VDSAVRAQRAQHPQVAFGQELKDRFGQVVKIESYGSPPGKSEISEEINILWLEKSILPTFDPIQSAQADTQRRLGARRRSSNQFGSF
jgi:hypothetical protein